MILLSLALIAATAAPEEAQPKAPPVDKDAEMVCRNAPQTGSRLRAPKICKTRAEWKASDATAGGADLDNARARSVTR
jgi:hypothetical protein